MPRELFLAAASLRQREWMMQLRGPVADQIAPTGAREANTLSSGSPPQSPHSPPRCAGAMPLRAHTAASLTRPHQPAAAPAPLPCRPSPPSSHGPTAAARPCSVSSTCRMAQRRARCCGIMAYASTVGATAPCSSTSRALASRCTPLTRTGMGGRSRRRPATAAWSRASMTWCARVRGRGPKPGRGPVNGAPRAHHDRAVATGCCSGSYMEHPAQQLRRQAACAARGPGRAPRLRVPACRSAGPLPGRLPTPAPARPVPAHLIQVDDTYAFISAVEQRRGARLEPCVLGGQSMGALVAAHAGEAGARPVDGLWRLGGFGLASCIGTGHRNVPGLRVG
jgi:hypothetical protein